MKFKQSLHLLLLIGVVSIFSVPVKATITVQDYWRMGENDPGAVAGGAVTQTIDSVGAFNLSFDGPATYSMNVSPTAIVQTASYLSINFTNSAYGSNSIISSAVDNFGIECWVNPTSVTNGQVIVYNGSTATTGWGLLLNGSAYSVLFGGKTIFGTGTAVPNVWTHLALVDNNGTTTLYVNGVVSGTSADVPATPTGYFAVGAPPQAPGSQNFGGLIDEVRFFTFVAGQFSTNDLLLYQTPPFRLGTTNLVVGPAANTNSVVLAVSLTNTAWTASANASWLHLQTANGIGSSNVIFSCDTNSGATRTGTLTIANLTLTVNQAGSTYVQGGALTTIVSSSSVSEPGGVAVDSAGNVYIANTGSSTILKWAPANNTLSTVIPASSDLDFPEDVAVDGAGNLYIADTGNAAVKEWTAANGVITPLMTGIANPWSVAVDGLGNVYCVSDLDPSVFEWIATNRSVTMLVSSGATESEGVTVDTANNVYYSDSPDEQVKEWLAKNRSNSAIISLSSLPAGLAVDGGGNVYIADHSGNSILKWSPATGISTLASSSIKTPLGVAVDSAQNVYLANSGDNVVQELPYAFVDPTTKSEPATAGSDSLPRVLPESINLNTPFKPTSDQSWLAITNTANGVVNYSFTANTSSPRTAHIQLLGQSITVNQAGPGTLQLGTTNLLEGAVSGTDSVIVVASPTTFAWTATANATWLHLGSGYQTGNGNTNLLFTFDSNPGAARTGTISIFNQTLTVTQAATNYVAASEPSVLQTNDVEFPEGMAMDSAGNIYWAAAGIVQEWNKTNGVVTTLISSGLSLAVSVAVDSLGNLYIADYSANTILKWTAANGSLATLVSSGLNEPEGITLDSAGDIYIADRGDNTIKEWLAANSNVVTVVSSGLDGPSGVALDLASNLYIADSFDNVLYEYSPGNGNLTALASASDGIYFPLYLAVDGSGNVYVGQPANGSVLERSPDGAINNVPVSSYGAAVDSSGDVFMVQNGGDDGPSMVEELPRAFLIPTLKSEPFTGANDTFAAVMPTNILLATGLYPTSDEPWVAVTGVTNGVTSFSIAPNGTGASRTANITLLGDEIPINQNAVMLSTTNLLEGPAEGTDSVVLAVSPPLISWTASANASWLHAPVGYPTVAVPTNVVFTFDTNSGATRTGTLTLGASLVNVTQAGSTYVAAPGPLTSLVASGLSAPANVAVDSSGNVYIANTGGQAMDEWSQATNSLEPLVYTGLGAPAGVAFDDNQGILFYSDTESNVIYAWVQGFGNTLYPFVTSGLNGPQGIAIDSSDDIYIAEPGTNAIEEWSVDTGNVAPLVSGLNHPEGVTVDAFGDVYIADTGNNAIKEWFAANSNVVTLVSTGLNHPAGVAVDASGNIFIADTGDSAVKKWTAASGTLSTLIGTGLNQPTGVSLDNADDLYIADTGNNAVKELPRAFVDATPKFEGYSAGSDVLPVILPASVNLLPPFAPASDQSWLTVTNTTGGIVNFAFTANVSTTRIGHLSVLGESVSVTQTNGPVMITSPKLTGGQRLINGGFQFTFTDAPGTTFSVLATTNLTLPLTNWVNVGTVSNISPGIYQFTTQPLTNSQEFFQVVWP